MAHDVMPDHTGGSDEPDASAPETARSSETPAPVPAARALRSTPSRRYPEHRPTAAGFAGMLSHPEATVAQVEGEAAPKLPARKASRRRSPSSLPASAAAGSAAAASAGVGSAAGGAPISGVVDASGSGGGPFSGAAPTSGGSPIGALKLNHHALRRADAALPSSPEAPGIDRAVDDSNVDPQADLSTITGQVHLPARKGGHTSPRSSVYHAAIEQAARERTLDHELHPRVDHTRTRLGVKRAADVVEGAAVADDAAGAESVLEDRVNPLTELPRREQRLTDDRATKDLATADRTTEDLATEDSVTEALADDAVAREASAHQDSADDAVAREASARQDTARAAIAPDTPAAGGFVRASDSVVLAESPRMSFGPDQALSHHDPSHTGIHGGVADIALIESTMQAARSSVEPVVLPRPARSRRLMVTILGVVVVALVIVGLALAAQLLPQGTAGPADSPIVAPSSTPTVGPSGALDPNSPVPVQTMTPAPTNSPVFEIPAVTP